MRAAAKSYRIRDAVAADLATIVAVDQAASELFRPTGLIQDMGDPPESIPIDELERAVAEHGLLALVDKTDVPVGFAMTRDRRPSLYLDQISIHPAHGKQGLGRWLMAEVIRRATHAGYRSVDLSTFRDLPWNGPFYRSLGFKELPRHKLAPWMRDIETVQAESMDVSLRCFMRRPTRRLPSLRRAG